MKTNLTYGFVMALAGAVLIVSLSGYVNEWPVLLQAIFYLVAGIAWIVPLKPVLQWTETGRFKP